jgi:uncharacterized protein with ParB-like and HNH nuclease domain
MRLGPLLSGPKQFVVPYFQRTYSWRRHQWTTLFDDILELYDLGSKNSHFLGSMVLLAEPGEVLAPTLVIDGQQRLVTLSLFLSAIRDTAREPDASLAERLHSTYLVNQDQDVKILTTHQDRAAFATVVARAEEPPPSPIRDAYRTFKDALKEQVHNGLDLDRLAQIVITQLSFVAITLDAEDNPYRIFESLNAKGMPLTQGDLLRNYFFMRLPRLSTSTGTPPSGIRCRLASASGLTTTCATSCSKRANQFGPMRSTRSGASASARWTKTRFATCCASLPNGHSSMTRYSIRSASRTSESASVFSA